MKAGGHAPFQNADAILEVRPESIAFVALNLPMLYRRSAEQIVQFHGFVGCHSDLVLAGFLPDPKVNMLFKVGRIVTPGLDIDPARLSIFGATEYDVRISVEKLAEGLPRERHNLKFLR